MALRSSSSSSIMMTELLTDALPPAYTQLCDSLRVERSWRNVQPILLATFTSVAQLLTTQAQQIQTLQHGLAQLQVRICWHKTTHTRADYLTCRYASACDSKRQLMSVTPLRNRSQAHLHHCKSSSRTSQAMHIMIDSLSVF